MTATESPATLKPASIGRTVRANRSTAELYEDAIRAGEGIVAADGPLVVRTGQAHRPLAAGQVHRPGARRATPRSGGARSTARSARRTTTASGRGWSRYVADRDLYAQDCCIGADPAHRRSLRVYTETAWASIFARNLFRRPDRRGARDLRAELHDHLRPLVQGRPGHRGHSDGDGDPAPPRADGGHHRRHGVRGRDQEVRVHGDELPPARRRRPADALGGQRRRGGRLGRVLRAVGHRQDDALGGPASACLVGDDEHGWGDDGSSTSRVAATPRRSASPRCTSRTSSRRRAGSGRSSRTSPVDPRTRELDLDSERFTENTRGAYPLEFIGNAVGHGLAGQPRNVVLLTADAFGVLPPISRLTHEQAQYHFISGYTAKLAGTEIGVKEPKRDVLGLLRRAVHATPPRRVRRDAGRAPRPPRRPGLAREHRLDRRTVRDRRADEHRPHPVDGPRRPRRPARRRADRRGPELRVAGPRPARTSRARSCSRATTWQDPAAYDRQARELARMFADNFEAYASGVETASGPPVRGRLAAEAAPASLRPITTSASRRSAPGGAGPARRSARQRRRGRRPSPAPPARSRARCSRADSRSR